MRADLTAARRLLYQGQWPAGIRPASALGQLERAAGLLWQPGAQQGLGGRRAAAAHGPLRLTAHKYHQHHHAGTSAEMERKVYAFQRSRRKPLKAAAQSYDHRL